MFATSFEIDGFRQHIVFSYYFSQENGEIGNPKSVDQVLMGITSCLKFLLFFLFSTLFSCCLLCVETRARLKCFASLMRTSFSQSIVGTARNIFLTQQHIVILTLYRQIMGFDRVDNYYKNHSKL